MIEGENIAMIGAYPPIHSGGIATHVHEISKDLLKYNMICQCQVTKRSIGIGAILLWLNR